jgi:SAM-dependent methyltransferase
MTIDGHPRYTEDWFAPFRAAIQAELRPGCVVIDVGGGRNPAISRSELPADATYIGIDLSVRELAAAPAGSYDRAIAADVTERQLALEGCADLVVSWQVLEHVAPLDEAISNIYSYLRPGGLFVAHLSGGRSAFALINRSVPHRLAKVAMKRLLQRDPVSVFPASYDRCTYSALSQMLGDWSEVRITPRYRGATYFRFVPPIQWVYLRLEDLMVRGNHRDLATHYLITAWR